MVARRLGSLFLLTTAGFALAACADFTSLAPPPTASDVFAAYCFSPLLTLLGGSVEAPHADAFQALGFLFWPGWWVLAVFWFRRPTVLVGSLVVLWSLVGVFQPVHRLWVMMSV